MTRPGFDDEEPAGMAVAAWLGLAALSVTAAVALWQLAPLPRTTETASIDQMTTGSLNAGSTDIAANSRRSDLAAVPSQPDPELKAQIVRLQNENLALRQSIDQMRSRVEILADRVDAVDGRFADVTGSISRQPVKPAPPPQQSPPVNLMPEEIPAENPPLTRTEFGVELGAFTDLSDVRKAWRDLLAQQPGLLQDLNPVASIRDRAGKTELVLVAGPFGNAADAAARCALIETAGLACLPAFYLGQQIGSR